MKSITNHPGLSASVARRGNTIVLVTGILVLLVIIATAYVTRTQSARYTAVATVAINHREDVHKAVADMLSNEVSLMLFVRNAMGVSSNAPRDLPNPNASRYGVDQQFDPATGDLLYPFNFAPYHVVPWTNWPDDDGTIGAGNQQLWPKGVGNPTGGGSNPFQIGVLASEDNPFGNPGFGDSRPLRDLEPLRWDSDLDGLLDAFSHWRHMTYIARPDNAIRAVFDISDIGDSNNDGYGRVVTDLSIPIEQFLTMNHGYLNPATGDTSLFINGLTPAGFVTMWGNWMGIFNGFNGYQNALTNPIGSPPAYVGVPPNFVRLSDINGNGIWHEAGERPEDEFVVGSSRWYVSKILCDTDGDGYTDSFWYLAPTAVSSGIRTVIGVSIVDNCGMINGNVGTRYLRNNYDFTGVSNRKTRGHTPVDIALVADLQFNSAMGNWNVGFYDNWEHWFAVASDADAMYDMTSWVTHCQEIGMYTLGGAGVPTWPDMFLRLDYWRKSASGPLSADPFARYSPYTLGDEIELRMFAGNNYPWAVTRFERSTEGTNVDFRLLRSNVSREEASEYLDQLTNRELVADLRHRLTLYSAARNDVMPPWTWRFDRNRQPFTGLGGNEDINADGTVDVLDVNLFAAGTRKFDLRTSFDASLLGPFGVNGVPGFANVTHTGNGFDPQSIDYNQKFGLALRDHLEKCLIDSQPNINPADVRSYFGAGVANTSKTEELSAALAANIVARRDADRLVILDEAVPVSSDPNTSFLGIEPQPFLVEVFIGHVYKPYIVPGTDQLGDPYTDAGDYLLLDPGVPDQHHRSTVVVVQIANPFDVPIDLSDYKITVFGQDFELANAVVRDHAAGTETPAREILEPGTPERPTTAIYYSIADHLINGGLPGDTKWKNFLDIDDADFNNTYTIVATSPVLLTGNSAWSQDRDVYDTLTGERAVELSRRDQNPAVAAPQWIVIDRIDREEEYDPGNPGNMSHFGQAVRLMGEVGQKPWPVPAGGLNSVLVGDPAGMPWINAYNIPPNPDLGPAPIDIAMGPPAMEYDQWVQFVRATRSWAADLNNNGRYDPHEQNPRFVFSDKAIVTPIAPQLPAPSIYAYNYLTDGDNQMGPGRGGYRYKFTKNPDNGTIFVGVSGTQELPWFTRRYYDRTNRLAADPQMYNAADPTLAFPRKPTFFNMNRQNDPAIANNDPAYPNGWSFPDKGWYSQRGVDVPVIDLTTGGITASLDFPLQMLHKDGDFEQVGELLNVWMFGHKISGGPAALAIVTERTFSEYLFQTLGVPAPELPLVGRGTGVNRLRLLQTNQSLQGGQVIGMGLATDINDVRHSIPDVPAAARILDAFVCDGYGVDPAGVNSADYNLNGQVGAADTAVPSDADLRDTLIFYNAKGFDGTGTSGLLNLNTAPPEVLQALPMWFRLVHESGRRWLWSNPAPPFATAGLFNYVGHPQLPPLVIDGGDPAAQLPRSMVAEALWQYRERFNGVTSLMTPTPPNRPFTGTPFGADYEQRANNVRGERGVASAGELGALLNNGQAPVSMNVTEPNYLDRPSAGVPDRVYDQQWRIDLGLAPTYKAIDDAADPQRAKPMWGLYPNTTPGEPYQESLHLSSDVSHVYDPFNSDMTVIPPVVATRPDNVAGDIEEANALIASVSNLVTTRSDTFTVYFRVRSFRQNTSIDPPVWDATNPDYIVDDSRYVMLIDRSNVNKPGDKPRVLYLEKLPN